MDGKKLKYFDAVSIDSFERTTPAVLNISPFFRIEYSEKWVRIF
jgi:hypothetical protein